MLESLVLSILDPTSCGVRWQIAVLVTAEVVAARLTRPPLVERSDLVSWGRITATELEVLIQDEGLDGDELRELREACAGPATALSAHVLREVVRADGGR